MEELIEKYAIRIARGNNGGEWSTHYTEAQKYFWRDIVRDLIEDYDEYRDGQNWPSVSVVRDKAEIYVSEFPWNHTTKPSGV
jgi:hypothetical protein